jgi:hypothetical protein
MDDLRFDVDGLARKLAGEPGPRRIAFRYLAGGFLGAALAAVGVGDAVAGGECKPVGAVCRRPGDCCSGKRARQAGAQRGRCKCPIDQRCGGSCCDGQA